MSEEKRKINKKQINIVIIDSGINTNHPLFKNVLFDKKSLAIHCNGSNIIVDKDIEDRFGHGTAVCGILTKLVPEIKITVLKIFDYPDLHANELQLIAALDYIIHEVDCDIVHMSLGITTHSKKLQDRCKRLKEKGVILVAAYDNAGGVSYPAIYREVIGVDSDARCIHSEDFFVVENEADNNVMVLAKGGNHRLAWTGSSYIISQGSSFSAAYVTAFIAKLLIKENIKRESVLQEIKKIAKRKVQLSASESPKLFNIPFEINKAVLYPYNKEMHSLINYSDYLNFEIKAVCDSKYTGRIGKRVYSLNRKITHQIVDIKNVNWAEIDTLILGHVDELEESIGVSIKSELLKICIKNGVNIYSFDDRNMDINSKEVIESNIQIFIPKVCDTDYLKFYCGKLFQLKNPTIAVFGTSSKQGKFTLQIALRNAFIKHGYSVAQIGTEPSSLLFGFDACFPFGYNSTIRIGDNEFIGVLNKIMHDVELRRDDADLTIIGCQSGTVPMLYNHVGQMTTKQLCFLQGALQDVVILCVNPDDDIEYIERTIMAIEGVSGSAVVGLALYPMSFLNGWQMMNSIKTQTENLEEVKRVLSEKTKKRVFVIGNEKDVDELCELCIDFLAEEVESE